MYSNLSPQGAPFLPTIELCTGLLVHHMLQQASSSSLYPTLTHDLCAATIFGSSALTGMYRSHRNLPLCQSLCLSELRRTLHSVPLKMSLCCIFLGGCLWAGGECWHQEKGSKSLLSCLPWHGDLKLQGKVTVSSKAAGGQSGDEIGVYVACF